MKKRVYALLFAMVMILMCLTACNGGDDQAKTYESYAKFYEEFCEENDDEDGDCGGQILIDKDGEPLLALCDIFEKSGAQMADVYVCKYEDGEVTVIEKQKNITVSGEGIFIDTVDGVVTLYVPSQMNQFGGIVYTLIEDDFDKNVVSLENQGDVYADYWKKAFNKEYSLLFQALFCQNEDNKSISGDDFEKLLECLVETKPATTFDLKVLYTDFFKEEKMYDEVSYSIIDESAVYCYHSAENLFYYAGTLDLAISEERADSIKTEINGIKVEIADSFIDNIVENLSYEQVQSLECLEDKLVIETINGFTFEIPTTYVDENDFACEFFWDIYIEQTGESMVSNAQSATLYLENGLVTNVEFYLGTDSDNKPIVEGITLTLADMDSYLSVLSEEEQLMYMLEMEVIPAYRTYLWQWIL